MGIPLVPTAVTLNAVIALFCVISLNSIALQVDYVTVENYRAMMSANAK